MSLADSPAEKTAAASADDMRHLGDIILCKYAVYYFRSQIQHCHKYKGEGYLAASAVGKGAEKYHHKRNSAGTQQGNMGEENNVYKPCDKGGEGYHYKQPFAAVFLLEHWSHKKDYGEISHKMAQVGVS